MGRELKYAICNPSVTGPVTYDLEFKSFGFEISPDNNLIFLTSFSQEQLRGEINTLASLLKKDVGNLNYSSLVKITEAMKVYAHVLSYLNSPNQVVLIRYH